MAVLQRITLSVPANRREWSDSGMVLGAGESVRIVASGPVTYHGSGRFAFPEGAYPDNGDQNHIRSPGEVRTTTDAGIISGLPASNINVWSLAVAIRPGNAPPGPGIGGPPIADALQGDREVTFTPGAGRLWLVFNDNNTRDNGRDFAVTLEKIGAIDPLMPGEVSPIRFVPPALARIKARAVAPTALCWFIQPQHGPGEGYTEFDRPLPCPAYSDATGLDENMAPLWTSVPALTYQPFSGLGVTGVPTSVKLGVDAPDVSVVAFDVSKLRREYYEGALVEIFEVALGEAERFAPSGDAMRSNRTIYLTGTLGNAQGTDADERGLGAATIELTPFDELLNTPVGATIGPTCDVGRLIGESWGTRRCRNEVLNDGPDAGVWTRGARVQSVSGLAKLMLVAQSVDGKSGFESNFPGSNGILQFKGGALDGLRRDVGNFVPATGELILRRALPQMPETNATAWLIAGCDKTLDGPQGCVFWNNVKNFRRHPHVPGRAALGRRYTT